MTKDRTTKPIGSDTTHFMLEIGPRLLEALGNNEEKPTQDFSKAAYLPNSAFVD